MENKLGFTDESILLWKKNRIGKVKKMKRIKCFLTGGCKFKSTDTQSKYDDETKEVTITETCYKCGKKYSFTAPIKNFGLDI